VERNNAQVRSLTSEITRTQECRSGVFHGGIDAQYPRKREKIKYISKRYIGHEEFNIQKHISFG
jgi:hypothetical protein